MHRFVGIPILVFAMAFTACEKKTAPEAVLQTVRGGTVTSIRPGNPERYSAVVVPFAQVDLAFKSPGFIQRIHQVRGADGRVRDVGAGDRIAKGTELALVRPADYQQRVDQATAQLAQSRALLAQAEAGLKDAQLDYERANNLYHSASLVKPQFDQAEARWETAKAQVEAARAGVANADTQMSEAKLSLSDTSVRAPFSGWITARNVEVGSLVGNATPGFSMVDTHLVKAVFAVSDISLKSVRLGRSQTVTFDAINHPVTGTITSISPQADLKSRVFSVEVTLPNPRNEVRPGMIGALTLDGTPSAAAHLVVPLSAVVRVPGNTGGFGVFVLEDSGGKTIARARSIQVGSTFGNAIEVTSGLSEGERIVTLGAEMLRSGQQVRVLAQ